MVGRAFFWCVLLSALATSASQELSSRRYLRSRCSEIKRWLQSRPHDTDEEQQRRQGFACLGHLEALLHARGRAIEHWLQPGRPSRARSSGSSSPPLAALALRTGHVSVLELRHAAEPRYRRLLRLAQTTREMSRARQSLLRLSGNASLGDAVRLQQLEARDLRVEYLNGRPADLDRRLICAVEQRSPRALSAERLIVDQLSVSSLCGHGAKDWMRVDDELRSDLATIIGTHGWHVEDARIVVRSAVLPIARLSARRLNGLELRTWLADLFRIGGKQRIAGGLRNEVALAASALRIRSLNGAPSDELLRRSGEQRLRRAFVDRLRVERVRADRINGVAVSEAAKRSTRNLVRGQLRLGRLRASGRLLLRQGALARPAQAYEQVRIEGDVRLARLRLQAAGALALLGGLPVKAAQVRALPSSCWSRSGDQRLPGAVLLAAGASVEQLDCIALNGLTESDLLYADSASWHGLRGLRLDKLRLRSSPRQALRLRRLSVAGARARALLARGSMRVDGRLVARETRLRPIIDSSACLRTDRPLTLEHARTALATAVQSVTLIRVNAHDLEALLARADALGHGSKLRLTGELRLRGGLRAERLNGRPVLEIEPGHLLLNSALLRVSRLRLAQLNGRNLDDYFDAALSRSARQTLAASLMLKGSARFANLAARYISGCDLRRLAFVDWPGVLSGAALFSRLRISGDVASETVDGRHLVESGQRKERMRRLPIGEHAANLLVQSQLSWDESHDESCSPPTSHSPARLLAGSVNRQQNQVVRTATGLSFGGALHVQSIHGSAELSLRVGHITADALLDEGAVLAGSKSFERGLSLDSLELDGELDVASLNALDVRRLASRLLRKDEPAELLASRLTFLGGVHVARLHGGACAHGLQLRRLVLVGQALPISHLQFRELLVSGDVSLRRLDGLVFDDLMGRRASTDSQLLLDLEFSRSPRVLHGSWVSSLNAVAPQDLLSRQQQPIIVHGRKAFASRVLLQRGLRTVFVNDLRVGSVHDNGLPSGADAHVSGSMVLAAGVRMSANLSLGGEANGLSLQRWSELESLRDRLALNALARAISALNSSCQPSRGAHEALDAGVRQLYLEEDRRLARRSARLHSVHSRAIAGNSSRLEIVTSEAAALCSLPEDCSCRRQYIVDLSSSMEYKVRESNANEITWTFHPRGQTRRGLQIVSKSRSYSQRCSQSVDDETSQMFSLRSHANHETRLAAAPAISDYVSDAQSFQLDDQLYVIVAIFYSRVTKSHATDSLLYQLDLTNGNTSLLQTIPTNGAKNIHLFRISSVGLHLLIGCVKGRAESLLLRFNPLIRQFQPIRAFATGGSQYLASVGSNEKSFVLLDNPDVRALQIFEYNENHDNFFDYQNIFFQSRVSSLGVLYSADPSDAFVVTTTRNGWLYIYEYMFFGKFQLKMSYWTDDIQISTPFRHAKDNYLFTAGKFNSTVYKVVQQG